MAMWLYQMTEGSHWSPERYRQQVWEGKEIDWPVSRLVKGNLPDPGPGDMVVFFFAPTRDGGGICSDPGFYGWAIIEEFYEDHRAKPKGYRMMYRPAPPSDLRKMAPSWDPKELPKLVDMIRGKVAQGALWHIPSKLFANIRQTVLGAKR